MVLVRNVVLVHNDVQEHIVEQVHIEVLEHSGEREQLGHVGKLERR